MAHPHRLERVQFIPRPRGEVFAFFADAGNLERITPPWLHFKILTPLPLAMGAGTLIDYRLRLHGVPIRWRTRIESWTPDESFTDLQLRGPYRLWHHRHEFRAVDGGTEMRDLVDYALHGGALAAPIHHLYVAPALAAIFGYRRDVIAQAFPT